LLDANLPRIADNEFGNLRQEFAFDPYSSKLFHIETPDFNALFDFSNTTMIASVDKADETLRESNSAQLGGSNDSLR
jgi:hypothetical protein